MMKDQKHTTGYVGASLIVGLATGLAAGLFLRSSKGKQLTADMKKMAGNLQTQLDKKLKKIKHLTKETYDELVEEIVTHYQEQKELAQDELAQLKEYLLGQWEAIREQMQQHGEDDKEA